ncbi:MAG: hypothetical protein ABS939_13510 [Psychrobacillus sp.]
MMEITIPYYEDKTRISNSNIGWFLNKGPAFLHKMLTEDVPEEKNPVLERGTMIHEYILQPEEFQKDYVVWDKSRPNSAQQEKFCQALAFSTEIEPNRAILDAYKQAYSTAGKSEDKMLSEGLKIASTLKDYVDYLKSGDQRIMISPYDYQMLKTIGTNIKAHKIAYKIIWPLTSKNVGTSFKSYHEFHINWEWEMLLEHSGDPNPPELLQVACKSLLDGLTIDFKNQKVIIYDLKTTQKLWNFEDSVEQYDYLRQLCFYFKAVQWYLKNELNEDPNVGWTFEFYIIGIDTTGTGDIRVFKFDPTKDFFNAHKKIINALIEIAWHQSTGKWDHSREYYEGDGSESLNL